MAYTYNKPDATDTISSSQSVLKDNFIAIKQLVDVNHATFGDPSEGKHNIVHFPALTVTPGSIPAATLATEYAIYSTSNGLFIRPPSQAAGTVTADANITGATKASPGWCYLPCGIIMKWGSGTISGVDSSGTTGTATLISGAGIPTITTVLSAMVCKSGGSAGKEAVVSYSSFDESAHTVTAFGYKPFSDSTTAYFSYFLMGI